MTNIVICIVDEELYSSSLNKIVCLSVCYPCRYLSPSMCMTDRGAGTKLTSFKSARPPKLSWTFRILASRTSFCYRLTGAVRVSCHAVAELIYQDEVVLFDSTRNSLIQF